MKLVTGGGFRSLHVQGICRTVGVDQLYLKISDPTGRGLISVEG